MLIVKSLRPLIDRLLQQRREQRRGELGTCLRDMACIATWAFGLVAVETAARSIEGGSDCVDAVEAAINGTKLCVCVCACTYSFKR